MSHIFDKELFDDIFGQSTSPRPAREAQGPPLLRSWPLKLGIQRVTLRLEHYLAIQAVAGLTRAPGPVQERLLREVQVTEPGYVDLWMHANEDNTKVALATTAGLKAAKAWIEAQPYQVAPRLVRAKDLMKNYNKWVATESEMRPLIDAQQFRRACENSPAFKERWGPCLAPKSSKTAPGQEA